MTSDSGSGFPSTVRVSGLNTTGKGGSALVGQVFSMCDLSGTGLMAVSTHFDIPFLSKRYTPYFFDKNMLDNILEDSVDQHFHSLIQTRQRRRDVFDDNLAAEVIEEMGDSMWEPPEVQDALDEVGQPAIPLSVISKATEIQVLHAVDKVLLGNRWLRKATGIQPKFPYMVDSFEKRSAASFQRACRISRFVNSCQLEANNNQLQCIGTSAAEGANNVSNKKRLGLDLRLPFGGWLSPAWSERQKQQQMIQDKREVHPSPLLPKITMVGISMGEAGQVSKATLKKTMEDLTKELEHTDQKSSSGNNVDEITFEERDPLFVANVGDYHSSAAKGGSSRWVQGGTF